MIKRILCFLMAGVMLLCLSACSFQQPEISSGREESSQMGNTLSSDSSTFLEESSQAESKAPASTKVPVVHSEAPEEPSQTQKTVLQITVGGSSFVADFAETEAAQALAEMLPMSLGMSDWEGVAKRFDLPSVMPEAGEELSKIQQGQILLEGSGSLCLFYTDASQSGNYTPIATVREPEGLVQAMAGNSVEVSFQLGEE